MDDATRESIREQAQRLVPHLDRLDLDVLRTHISIHRFMTRRVAELRGVPRQSLSRLGFMAAARELFNRREHRDLRETLKILNDARNMTKPVHPEGRAAQTSRVQSIERGQQWRPSSCKRNAKIANR